MITVVQLVKCLAELSVEAGHVDRLPPGQSDSLSLLLGLVLS